ncbi:MAG: UvrD-helicase domain-containing protein [Candidatus Auribacterota bacterium]|nr:UvrD-helicase domain-containing protein [Candidatus Auribacterota bacterium]
MSYKWEKQIEEILKKNIKATISASAGTGKTTLSMDKVTRFIDTGKTQEQREDFASSICCITFTKKAAGDFKERAREVLVEKIRKLDLRQSFEYLQVVDEIQISTIHSFAMRILREFAAYADVDSEPEIVDEDKNMFMRKAVREVIVSRIDSGKDKILNKILAVMPLESRGYSIGVEDILFDIVGKFQAADIKEPIEKFVMNAVKDEKKEIKEISLCLAQIADRVIERYGELKENKITYDEIILKARDLLRDYKDVRQELKKRFRLIILDEAQDTDNVQIELVLWLAENEETLASNLSEVEISNKLIVVGDFKQSIYGWRNANPEVFKNIQKQIGNSRPLRENRRSQKAIIEFINNLTSKIITDFNEKKDEIIARRKDCHASGKVYKLFNRDPFRNAAERRMQEADFLAKAISEMVNNGTFAGREVRIFKGGYPEKPSYSEIAILLRKMTSLSDYEAALRKHNVPYFSSGNRGFLSRFEVRDAINFLNVMANGKDELAYASLLRSFASRADDNQLIDKKLECKMLELKEGKERNTVPEISELNKILIDIRERKGGLSPAEMLIEFLEKTSYLVTLALLEDGGLRIANVKKLIEKLRKIEAKGYESLTEITNRFTNDINFKQDEGLAAISGEGDNSVKIMTVHKSKGLQFPIVVIPETMSYLRVPDKVIITSGGKFAVKLNKYWMTSNFEKEKERLKLLRQEEEQRLLYVAVTRPRDLLIISCLNKKPGLRKTSKAKNWFNSVKDIKPAEEIYIEDCIYSDSTQAQKEKAVTRPQVLDASKYSSFVFKDIEKETPPIERISVSHLLDEKGYTLSKDAMEQDVEKIEEMEEDDYTGSKAELGSAVHYVLEHFCEEDDIVRLLRHKLTEEKATQLVPVIKKFVRSKEYKEIMEADEVYRELPFVMREGNREVRGKIDCVYRKGSNITVVDFKYSPKFEGVRYQEQLDIYAKAFRQHLQTVSKEIRRAENISTKILYINKDI